MGDEQMTIKEEFEKAFENDHKGLFSFDYEFECALWGVKWALKKAEDACASPTSKGRILALAEELST